MVRRLRFWIFAFIGASTLAMYGCGGGGGSDNNSPPTPPPPTLGPLLSVGGTVSGLNGTLVLRNNGGDDLTIATDGSFVFATRLASNAAYAVSVLSQPSAQVCSVATGSGTIGAANVTSVAITCSTPPAQTYAIGGTAAGLVGTVVLQNNATDNLTLSSNGPFSFATRLTDGVAYDVHVLTQPANQQCTVADGSGSVAAANVTSIKVTCTTPILTYTIGGSVSGLTSAITLRNNGVDDLTVSTDGPFTFATQVLNGASYDVTAVAQVTQQACIVSAGSGTVTAANVTNIRVVCTKLRPSKYAYVTSNTRSATTEP